MVSDEEQARLDEIIRKSIKDFSRDPVLATHNINNLLILGMLNEQRETNKRLELLLQEILRMRDR